MLAMVCNMISLLWSVAVIRCWNQNVADTCCFRFVYSISCKVAPWLCIRRVCVGRDCDCDQVATGGGDNPTDFELNELNLTDSKGTDSFRHTQIFRKVPQDWKDHTSSPPDEEHTAASFTGSKGERYISSCRCNFVLRVLDKVLFVTFFILLSLSELTFLVSSLWNVVEVTTLTTNRIVDAHNWRVDEGYGRIFLDFTRTAKPDGRRLTSFWCNVSSLTESFISRWSQPRLLGYIYVRMRSQGLKLNFNWQIPKRDWLVYNLCTDIN